jgi:hypothetical protein
MRMTSLLFGSLTLAFSHVPLSADATVYVVSAGLTGNGQVGTVNLQTGAYQQIGPTEPDGYFGLATGPNGTLVAGTYAGNVDSINPSTGVPIRIGPTGLGGCVVPSPSCGPNIYGTMGGLGATIYATDFQDNLYTVDPTTGAATLLNGNTGLPAIPFVPGSLNPDGTINFWDESIFGAEGSLYATFDSFVFDLNTSTVVNVVVAPELYRIDPSTGTATAIGSTDLGIGAAVDVNGTAYAFNDLTDQITSIDLSSGSTSFVANFDPSAGVIQGAAVATPEPGSIGPATVALVAFAFLRRRRSRILG